MVFFATVLINLHVSFVVAPSIAYNRMLFNIIMNYVRLYGNACIVIIPLIVQTLRCLQPLTS